MDPVVFMLKHSIEQKSIDAIEREGIRAIFKDLAPYTSIISIFAMIRQLCYEPTPTIFAKKNIADDSSKILHIFRVLEQSLSAICESGEVDDSARKMLAKAKMYHQRMDVSHAEFELSMAVLIDSFSLWLEKIAFRKPTKIDGHLFAIIASQVGQAVGIDDLPRCHIEHYRKIVKGYHATHTAQKNDGSIRLYHVMQRSLLSAYPISGRILSYSLTNCLDSYCRTVLGFGRPSLLRRSIAVRTLRLLPSCNQ